MSDLSADTLRHALETARRNGFRVVKLVQGDAKFRATLGEPDCSAPEPALEALELAAVVAEEPKNGLKEIGASHVGYFHFGKKPVQVGDKLEVGQAVGEIHALGIANEVMAGCGGEVVEIIAADGEAVEYGMALFKVKA